MKASEAIQEIQKMIEHYGDLEIVAFHRYAHTSSLLSEINHIKAQNGKNYFAINQGKPPSALESK